MAENCAWIPRAAVDSLGSPTLSAAGMPPFSHILNDEEVSSVVTYIRVAWENSGTPVTPTQANELRKLLPV
jgi:mono/diheme cytochrome c family protein